MRLGMEQLSDTCSAEKQLLRAMLRMAKEGRRAVAQGRAAMHVEQSEGGQRGRRPACSAAGAE
jgi:ferritin-like metal-binding protein YciE